MNQTREASREELIETIAQLTEDEFELVTHRAFELLHGLSSKGE